MPPPGPLAATVRMSAWLCAKSSQLAHGSCMALCALNFMLFCAMGAAGVIFGVDGRRQQHRRAVSRGAATDVVWFSVWQFWFSVWQCSRCSVQWVRPVCFLVSMDAGSSTDGQSAGGLLLMWSGFCCGNAAGALCNGCGRCAFGVDGRKTAENPIKAKVGP